MNFSNFFTLFRNWKNRPAATYSARLLAEYVVDKSTCVQRWAICESITIAAAASGNLTTQLPAGARVLFANYILNGAMTLTTAVKLGIGTAADPDAFLRSGTTMTTGTAQSLASADATSTVAAATTIVLSTVDTSGAAAGSGSGTVQVTVVYEVLQAATLT